MNLDFGSSHSKLTIENFFLEEDLVETQRRKREIIPIEYL